MFSGFTQASNSCSVTYPNLGNEDILESATDAGVADGPADGVGATGRELVLGPGKSRLRSMVRAALGMIESNATGNSTGQARKHARIDRFGS